MTLFQFTLVFSLTLVLVLAPHFSPAVQAAARSPSRGASVAPAPAPVALALAPAPSPNVARVPSKSPTPASSTRNGTLHPSQVIALRVLGISTGNDPCNTGTQHITICDNGTPYRHLLSLEVSLCPEGSAYPLAAWNNLTSLNSLIFNECPVTPMQLPEKLVAGLTSLTIVQSLGRSVGNELAPGLPATWLAKFTNLAKLHVADVLINASSISAVVMNMTQLRELTLSNTNLTGPLPKTWPPKSLKSLQISGNDFNGGIPDSFSRLFLLQILDLSSNNLTGGIPLAMANLTALQALKLSSNKLTGSLPSFFQKFISLTVLDISYNRLNGSLPTFLSKMPSLRVMELQNNKFKGAIPFTDAFLKNLNTFKVSGNSLLCYKATQVSAKYVTGIQPCNINGLPPAVESAEGPSVFSPAPSPLPFTPTSSGKRGPKKIVLIVAIALAAIVAIIVVSVVISRCCSSSSSKK